MVLCYIMGLLFAGLQIGLISYYQLAMDEGSQVLARSSALGIDDATAQNAFKEALPRMHGAAITPIAHPNPIVPNTIADFGYGGTNARTGGFTIDAQMPTVSVITETGAGLFGLGRNSITIQSIAVEGATKELCPHYCLIKGGMASATANDAIDYFSAQGDNTAPYFIGFGFMRTCNSDPNADLAKSSSNGTAFGWSSCPTNSITWRALGSAAHLDETNSAYSGISESLSNAYVGAQLAPPLNDAKTGPFFELWCHRKVFAMIEKNAFPADSADPGVPLNQQEADNFLGKIFGSPMSPGSIIYNNSHAPGAANAGWDSSQLQGNSNTVTISQGPLSPWWGCGINNGALQ
jgi:hypothetical protein